MSAVRKRVYIYGRVQGVAYRYSARREARRLNLTGWIKNRMDGSVEALVEGDTTSIDKMLEWFHGGPPGAVVLKVETVDEPATGEFEEFEITF